MSSSRPSTSSSNSDVIEFNKDNKEENVQKRAKLLEEYNLLKKQYEENVKEFSSIPAEQSERERTIIELLHDYNDIKDACQIVLGAAANLQQCTIKDLHLKYNLPINE